MRKNNYTFYGLPWRTFKSAQVAPIYNQREFLQLVAATLGPKLKVFETFSSFPVLCHCPPICLGSERSVQGLSVARHPFFRASSGRCLVRSPHICWCVDPTFGPLRARLAPPTHPFQSPLCPPSYTASSPISENTLLLFSSFSKVPPFLICIGGSW